MQRVCHATTTTTLRGNKVPWPAPKVARRVRPCLLRVPFDCNPQYRLSPGVRRKRRRTAWNKRGLRIRGPQASEARRYRANRSNGRSRCGVSGVPPESSSILIFSKMQTLLFRVFACIFSVLAWLSGPALIAQTPIAIDRIVLAALDQHPALAAAAREPARIEAAFRAAYRPEPLSARGYYMPFSDPGDVYTEWEIVAGWNGPRTVRATRSWGAAAAASADADASVMRMALAEELLLAGVAAWIAERRIALLEGRLADARGVATWTADRCAAGLETDATASAAEFAAVVIETDLRRAESDRAAARAQLAAWAGPLPDGPLALPSGWWQDGPVALGDSAAAWARADARARRALLGTAEAERERAAEAALRGPVWQAGWNTQGVPGGVYRGATVGLAMPLVGRNAGLAAADLAVASSRDRADAVVRGLEQARVRDADTYERLRRLRGDLVRELADDRGEAALREALLAGGADFPAFFAALAARRAAEDALVELDAELLQVQVRLLIHRFQ